MNEAFDEAAVRGCVKHSIQRGVLSDCQEPMFLALGDSLRRLLRYFVFPELWDAALSLRSPPNKRADIFCSGEKDVFTLVAF